jgi:hypothetical protein
MLALAKFAQFAAGVMLSVLGLSATAAAPLSRAQHALVGAQSLVCLSVAVDTKTATCNVLCNSGGKKCPSVCYCLPPVSNASASDLQLAMPTVDYQRLSDLLERHPLPPSHLVTVTSTTALRRTSGLGGTTKKACTSISPSVKDKWCDDNCNSAANNCPPTVCKCDGVEKISTEEAKPATKAQSKDSSSDNSPSKPKSAIPTMFTPAQLPSEMVGFYMKAWTCTGTAEANLKVWDCAGPEDKNINVVFHLV